MGWPEAFVWAVGVICGTLAFCAVLGAVFRQKDPPDLDKDEGQKDQ